MSSSIARPSSWWNIGTCVASGVSGRYTRPGHDDVDRRLLELHRAHLHRRGVGAQQHVLGEVEGVLREPRRVLGRVVERGEVVVLVLDLGALDDREAEPDADVLHAPPDLRDQVQVADRQRAGRPGRVTSTRSSARRRSSSARLELRGAPLRAAPRAPGAPRWPACRPARAAPAAARRSSAAPAVSSDLRPEVAHPQLLELGGRAGGADRRPRPRCAAGPGQPWRGHPIGGLVEGDGSPPSPR